MRAIVYEEFDRVGLHPNLLLLAILAFIGLLQPVTHRRSLRKSV